MENDTSKKDMNKNGQQNDNQKTQHGNQDKSKEGMDRKDSQSNNA